MSARPRDLVDEAAGDAVKPPRPALRPGPPRPHPVDRGCPAAVDDAGMRRMSGGRRRQAAATGPVQPQDHRPGHHPLVRRPDGHRRALHLPVRPLRRQPPRAPAAPGVGARGRIPGLAGDRQPGSRHDRPGGGGRPRVAPRRYRHHRRRRYDRKRHRDDRRLPAGRVRRHLHEARRHPARLPLSPPRHLHRRLPRSQPPQRHLHPVAVTVGRVRPGRPGADPGGTPAGVRRVERAPSAPTASSSSAAASSLRA